MSKLPRNVTGDYLVKSLVRIGYVVVRQTGSHIRLKGGRDGKQPVTVPNHSPLRVGTLDGILEDIEKQTGMTRDALLQVLNL